MLANSSTFTKRLWVSAISVSNLLLKLMWDEEMFLEKKQLYGMTKWSPKLCQNFSSLCRKMMKSIWGYSFLG